MTGKYKSNDTYINPLNSLLLGHQIPCAETHKIKKKTEHKIHIQNLHLDADTFCWNYPIIPLKGRLWMVTILGFD